MLKFPTKVTGVGMVDIPHYTIAEVGTETGRHAQTIRNRIKAGDITSVMFKQKHYISQEHLDLIRSESPLAKHRVGVVGVKTVENDMTPDELEDLL